MNNRRVKGIIFVIVLAVILSVFVVDIPNFLDFPFIGGEGTQLDELSPDELNHVSNAIETYFKTKFFLMLVNSAFFFFFLVFYYKMYNKSGTVFTLGLFLLVFTMLINAIVSNPLLYLYFSYREIYWVRLFNIVPDVLTTVTSGILLYLTKE